MIIITEREWQARRRKERVIKRTLSVLLTLTAVIPTAAAVYLAFFRDR